MGPPTDVFGSFLWNVGYALCHQLPERSFFIGGLQMPVCARDVGTYVGFMAVLIAFVVLARYQNGKLPDKVIITVAAVGLAFYAFDAFSSYLGFRSTTNDIRLISGLAFGSGISMLLFSAVSNLLYGKRTDHSRRTFTYRDLPLVYLLIALLSVPLLIDSGIFFYYLESTIVIASLLFMVFLIMLILVVNLTGWSFEKDKGMFPSIATACVLEAAILIVLWSAHHFGSVTLL
jgi:uncharacterized membrane protein